ncbi:MAG: DUF2087 domain-containing protein [Chloroflexota bacterium]
MHLHPMNVLPANIELATIYNVLHSMALLSGGEDVPLYGQWVQQTIAAVSPEQQQRNRLVFEGLREVFVRDHDWPDFPTYLVWLATQNPFALRDAALKWLCYSLDGSAFSVQPDDLLTNRDTYLTCVTQVRGITDVDPAIMTEAHALLNDPSAMHDLIVEHVTELWEQMVALEWYELTEGRAAHLPHAVRVFQSHLAHNEPIATEVLRMVTGRPVPDLPRPGVDVSRVVLVPSLHVGRQVTTWVVDTTLYVFFAPPPQPGYILRSSPVGPGEMSMRLRALADETRLRIIDLVVQRNIISLQEIATYFALPQPIVLHHLEHLRHYLVECGGQGSSQTYMFNSLQFDLTVRCMEQLSAGKAHYPDATLQRKREQNSRILQRFLDMTGRLSQWPARVRYKSLVLEYLAAKFEPEQIYSERQVNILLLQHIDGERCDLATIRRALCEEEWLERKRDGSQYWRGPRDDQSFDEL